jgi:hypothetical protein
MIFGCFVILFIASILWLLSIRPYCRRNGKGYTSGANFGVILWIDWQEAKEISKAKRDKGMIMMCRVVLWLHIIAFAIFFSAIFRS